MAVSIIDHGKGIRKEDIEMVFEKYYSTAKNSEKQVQGLVYSFHNKLLKRMVAKSLLPAKDDNTEFCVKLPL